MNKQTKKNDSVSKKTMNIANDNGSAKFFLITLIIAILLPITIFILAHFWEGFRELLNWNIIIVVIGVIFSLLGLIGWKAADDMKYLYISLGSFILLILAVFNWIFRIIF
jgi:hypothetical protein